MPVYRELNHNFFKTWSNDMAYVLGFFAADGSMTRNNRGAHFIDFYSCDRYLIAEIKKILGSNHRIGTRNNDPKWRTGYRLQLGSKVMFSDLHNLGFTPNKSLQLKFPHIPLEYTDSFVRGYFDGDGNVYFKKHQTKDRKKPRWIFSTRFTSGTESYLRELLQLLHIRGLQRGFVLKKKRGFDLVFSHRDSIALYHLMYDNKPRIYLKRKYKLFQKAIKTLYGEERAAVAQFG